MSGQLIYIHAFAQNAFPPEESWNVSAAFVGRILSAPHLKVEMPDFFTVQLAASGG